MKNVTLSRVLVTGLVKAAARILSLNERDFLTNKLTTHEQLNFMQKLMRDHWCPKYLQLSLVYSHTAAFATRKSWSMRAMAPWASSAFAPMSGAPSR